MSLVLEQEFKKKKKTYNTRVKLLGLKISVQFKLFWKGILMIILYESPTNIVS